MDIRACRGLNSFNGGSCEKSKCGGEKIGFEGDEGVSGGADIESRLRRLDLRGPFAFVGRTGDEDSAPDWKMLLSSQPLSSVPGPN